MRHDLRDSGCAICRLGKRPFASQCHFDYGDDQGWGETGYHSHPHLKTPVLDEMASRGLRMDRFYAAHVMLANADECPYGPSPHSVWRIWSQLVHAT